MATTWQKTIIFNFSTECVSAKFWCIIEINPTNTVTSSFPLKIAILKHEITFLLLTVWQEVVPLLLNKKSHYYKFKMNIKIQNMCQTYLLVIRT